MAKKGLLRILLSLIFCLSTSIIFAETIVLKSGKTIEGKIIERTDKYIAIDFDGVSVPYSLEEIESIDGGPPGPISSEKAPQVIPEVSPDDAKTYYNRGVASAKKGDLNQAISDFNKAIELKPDYVEAYGDRGRAYYLKNEYDQVISDMNQVLKIKPDSFIAYCGLALTYAKKGDFDQAILDFNRAIEINPYYAEAYGDRANVYFLRKEYDNAWKDVHKAQELGYRFDPKFITDLAKASGKQGIESAEAYSIDGESSFRFKTPDKWTAASRSRNPEYYAQIINTVPSLKEAVLLCFPAQDNFSGFLRNPVPLITIVGKYRNLEGPGGVSAARQTIVVMIDKQKQIIAERKAKGFRSKTEIGFGIIRNNLKEEILRIPQIKEDRATGRKIISFLYQYNHISKDNKKFYTYFILGTCMLVDSEKSVDIFDDFAKNFEAID